MAETEPAAGTGDLPWSWPVRVDAIAAGAYGDCPGATDDTGAELTWRQLSQASRVVGKSLRRRGLAGVPSPAYPQSAGQIVLAPPPVVVMLPHTVEALAVILGVLRQGFPLMPLSVKHGDKKQLRQRYKEAMELFKPVAIISDSPLAQELLEHRPGLQVIPPRELMTDEDPAEPYEDVPTTLDNVLAYIFTSGSTGKSKCVTATNRMSWAEVQWYPQIFRNLGIRIDPRTDRWRNDHEMGWWGAAFFGEIDVALAMSVCVAMMKPNDADVLGRRVTLMGALPSQLQNLWPGARKVPSSLRAVFSWAERCEVELGEAWKRSGVKMADLLIASEFWLSLASCNLEVVRGEDGRAAHAMRAVEGAKVFVLDGEMKPLENEDDMDVSGMLGISGPQVSPGYAELLEDGTAAIGAGPLSKDVFRDVEGHWTVVPKDLVKRQPDQSLLSIGRGGGTVKVKGGVLMATNVAELELQKGAITAACITDPVHVEGGSCVVLEMNWQDVWSMRDSLQQASFLRMPILYVCKMPRNDSTGKVQKALVQSMHEQDFEAERALKTELHETQVAQLEWYGHLLLPLLLLLAAQPRELWGLLQAAVAADPRRALRCLATLPTEAALRLCLFAWSYGASGHVANLAKVGSLGIWDLTLPVGIVAVGGATPGAGAGLGVAGALLVLASAGGILDFSLRKSDNSGEAPGRLAQLRRRTGRLLPGALAALLPGLSGCPGATTLYALGLLCIFALNRRLPGPPWSASPVALSAQRVAATALSLVESLGYMLSLPVAFTLALPNLILGEFPNYAWSRMKRPGQPIAKKQSGWPYSGPWQQRKQVQGDAGKDGVLWFDAYEVDAGTSGEQEARPEVSAQTPAGARAQALAKQAGVDFQSVDSLRIARLSVLLKKYMQRRPGEEALEFSELREACSSEQSFVDLVDRRLLLTNDAMSPMANGVNHADSWQERLLAWAQGGAQVHREGATPAPWDCQVDVLMEWRGQKALEREHLEGALRDAMQQHPLLRAVPPPDDSTELLMGNGGSCDLCTTAGATWALVTAVWSGHHRSWGRASSDALRRGVAAALWRCWPRTLVAEHDGRRSVEVFMVSEEYEEDNGRWKQNVADKVNDVLGRSWEQWWNPRSMFNVCVVTLNTGSGPRQFLYATTSHKYCDGGSAAAFVHSLSEHYEARTRGECGAILETPVLRVQQERLWNYLSGRPCPKGSVDAYFQDINHDCFYHDSGNGVGVCFTERVCDVMRVAGLRMACSEEIAWLACIVCALFRLMPDEKLIKVLMVHNGRLGDAEGVIACTNQYVVLSVPCASERSNTPLADVASRVKHAVTNGRFTRPAPCEQTHAKINIGGMIGSDGDFVQVFRSHRPKKGGRSRAPHALQLRMDNEGGTWCVKDFKLHRLWDPKTFWEATLCASQEIAQGWFINPLAEE